MDLFSSYFVLTAKKQKHNKYEDNFSVADPDPGGKKAKKMYKLIR